MERGAIILVGMMGAGKTTIGKALAARLGYEFVDMDALIEAKLGSTIQRIFQVYGEPAFRDHETTTLRTLARNTMVLSTGGGAVLRDANWKEFRRLGTTVFLDVELPYLIERMKRSRKPRPLLQTDDWQASYERIWKERQPLYQMADVKVTIARGTAKTAAERILRALGIEP